MTLCKQRVLTYAARQTEQSIRLGMWMDWNDPDELRRLHDLLATDPAAVTTIQGPNGPVTDTVEMLVGRLGMPEIGGGYFTFSNENNDLIWGFLAEVHRRGWLYKGHDTMPWCARCGTGLSQMEMNEGYQDREDPGLDRPLPAGRSTGRVAAGLDDDAVDAHVERRGRGRREPTLRPRPPGRRHVLARQGHAQDRAAGPVRGPRGAARRAISSAGATQARSTTCLRSGVRDGVRIARPAYEHRVVAWSEVGEEEGTGIVHIAPGCGAEDFQLGKALGLPVIAPIDESGIFLDGFGSLSGRDVRDVTEPIVAHLQRHRTASTASSRTPTATRTAGGAGRRSSSGSSTSGSSRWARSTTSRATR